MRMVAHMSWQCLVSIMTAGIILSTEQNDTDTSFRAASNRTMRRGNPGLDGDQTLNVVRMHQDIGPTIYRSAIAEERIKRDI